MVVSNTSKDTLISMRESLKERLLPLGHLIVSGIQANEKREVAEIYGNSGYDIVSGKVEGGWAGLLLRLKKTRKPEK